MARPKPSLRKLLERVYAEGYGDSQRAIEHYWENPTLYHLRRYTSRKEAIIKDALRMYKDGE